MVLIAVDLGGVWIVVDFAEEVEVDVDVDEEGETKGRWRLEEWRDPSPGEGMIVEYERFLSDGANAGGEEDRYELDEVDWKGDCGGGCGVIWKG